MTRQTVHQGKPIKHTTRETTLFFLTSRPKGLQPNSHLDENKYREDHPYSSQKNSIDSPHQIRPFRNQANDISTKKNQEILHCNTLELHSDQEYNTDPTYS